MLFNLFSKKSPAPAFREMLWMTTAAKWNGLLELIQQHPDAVIAAWFPDTIIHLKDLLQRNGINNPVHDARRIHSTITESKALLIAEHYPLRTREENLLQMNASEVIVLSALEEPLFQYFGGSHLLELMQKIGAKEDEIIEHDMVKKAIANAQEKLAKKVLVENTAHSAEAWFQKNVQG